MNFNAKPTKKSLIIKLSLSAVGAIAFFVLVALLLTVDRAPSGETQTVVGLSTFNSAVFSHFGTSDAWYTVTKLLGYAELASVAFFGCLFIVQWIRRKKLSLVDRDLFALAALYAAVAILYILFELVVINCRPVFTDGKIEASFPSSHSLIAVFTMGAAALQAKSRLRRGAAVPVIIVLAAACFFSVFGRLCAGVHWATDILGSVALGAAILPLYDIAASSLREKQKTPSADPAPDLNIN